MNNRYAILYDIVYGNILWYHICNIFRFAENSASFKSDLGEQIDQQLKQLITEFADGMEEHQRLPPHRGHLDHKVKLTGYPHRQRRN